MGDWNKLAGDEVVREMLAKKYPDVTISKTRADVKLQQAVAGATASSLGTSRPGSPVESPMKKAPSTGAGTS